MNDLLLKILFAPLMAMLWLGGWLIVHGCYLADKITELFKGDNK